MAADLRQLRQQLRRCVKHRDTKHLDTERKGIYGLHMQDWQGDYPCPLLWDAGASGELQLQH